MKAVLMLPVLILATFGSPSSSSERVEAEPLAPLLTSDFGIVTKDDQQRIGERVGVPFSPAPEPNYLYWQCLRLDRSFINCSGYSHYTRKAGPKGDLCVAGIDVVSNDSLYSFFFHQLWDWDSYEDVRREFQELLRGQKVACFGAEYTSDNFPQEPGYIRTSSWFLKYLKTKKGSWSYSR